MERDVEPVEASRKWVYGLAALVVAATVLAMASVPPRTQTRLEAVSREQAYLTARQDVLRRAAFDLADEFYRQIEQDRRVLERFGLGDPAWDAVCPPPANRTGNENEAVLAWLSHQTSHVQTLPPAVGARSSLALPMASARESDVRNP